MGALLRNDPAPNPGRSSPGLAVAPTHTGIDDGAVLREASAIDGAAESEPRLSPVDVQAAERQEAGSRRYTPIVDAARQVSPSVVSIRVLRRVRGMRRNQFGFFQGPEDRSRPGLGSGFAIDAAGTILTNEHVVAGADSIVVADATGNEYRAELVGADELTDIAVLRVDGNRIPPAPLGTSSDLMVGEPAIAIGNPFGHLLENSEATVTAGVVSGVGRDIKAKDQRQTLLADMVQTDASINPGNSGGPLVNADGQVIGVNSSIFSYSGGSEGLGFAIPIDRALRVAEELKTYGRIRRPYVGIDAVAVESDKLLGDTQVRRVAPGSPAENAGIRPGDVLVGIEGRPIDSPLDWEVGLLDAGVGSSVTITYLRAGKNARVTLGVEEVPDRADDQIRALEGLELISVDEALAVQRRLEVDVGALVAEIDERSTEVTGLRPGDVILAINRRRVETADDAADLFQYYAGRGRIRVTYYREGRLYYSSSFSVG
jgi:serine protease Do